jgi:arsenite methyltransferase
MAVAGGGRAGPRGGWRLERGLPQGRVGCIAGALSESEYEQGLLSAGFGKVSNTFTHEVADGMHAAIVKAAR